MGGTAERVYCPIYQIASSVFTAKISAGEAEDAK